LRGDDLSGDRWTSEGPGALIIMIILTIPTGMLYAIKFLDSYILNAYKNPHAYILLDSLQDLIQVRMG